jgi:hypothetical protein
VGFLKLDFKTQTSVHDSVHPRWVTDCLPKCRTRVDGLRARVHGGLWLGFRQRVVAYFKDHAIRLSYGREQGFGEWQVSGLKLDDNGAIWAATGFGLHLIRNGHASRLSTANGLPCDTVHWVLEDSDHFFWSYTACGLVRIARAELDRWAADPKFTISATIFDNGDGVRSSLAPTDGNPMVARSTLYPRLCCPFVESGGQLPSGRVGLDPILLLSRAVWLGYWLSRALIAANHLPAGTARLSP